MAGNDTAAPAAPPLTTPLPFQAPHLQLHEDAVEAARSGSEGEDPLLVLLFQRLARRHLLFEAMEGAVLRKTLAKLLGEADIVGGAICNGGGGGRHTLQLVGPNAQEDSSQVTTLQQ